MYMYVYMCSVRGILIPAHSRNRKQERGSVTPGTWMGLSSLGFRVFDLGFGAWLIQGWWADWEEAGRLRLELVSEVCWGLGLGFILGRGD